MLDKSTAWLETVLYNFKAGRDGAYPWANLLLDQDQNVYGTTYAGGDSYCTDGAYTGCGVVFKITR
jgi:hypothetical protein